MKAGFTINLSADDPPQADKLTEPGSAASRVFPLLLLLVQGRRPSTLQPHTFLHPPPRPDALAPRGNVLEAGAVDQGFAPGVDRIEAEIGDGDFTAGEIGRVGQLLVCGAELGDEAVLIEL